LCPKTTRIVCPCVVFVKHLVSGGLPMLTQATSAPRFVRRTQLAPHEYRKNFRQLDEEIIAAITSPEADRVTPLMSKIYLRLVNAPVRLYEREGVLRFEGEVREGQHVKAWSALCELLGVASATANKALAWLHEQGIVGYYAGKNGVGIRIFLNRAVSSIGVRANSAGKKILPFAPASKLDAPASFCETAFNDSFAVLENLETDFDPSAPENGAGAPQAQAAGLKTVRRESMTAHGQAEQGTPKPFAADSISSKTFDELANVLRQELEPAITSAAVRAAQREHERTREWLEQRGLPKAARVAQREAYNLLRQHGMVKATSRRNYEVETSNPTTPRPATQPLRAEELEELASMCLAMHEIHGQAFQVTLAALSSDVAGSLSAEDAAKVLNMAEALIGGR
jgi:DNA-binding transcriptional regulator YhcF (GntR family)